MKGMKSCPKCKGGECKGGKNCMYEGKEEKRGKNGKNGKIEISSLMRQAKKKK